MMKAGQIENSLRLKLSPTQSQIPRMYGQVKIHKEGYPLREIVDANGGATKPIDGYIAKITSARQYTTSKTPNISPKRSRNSRLSKMNPLYHTT